MKRLLVVFAALVLLASCSLAQSELPKLHLSEIRDQSALVYNTEWYTEYETGSYEDDTYMYARYDYYGDLAAYDYSFDCGCVVMFEGNGMTYDQSKCPQGLTHTAPVKHPYKLELLDGDVVEELNRLSGKNFTYAYLKDPAPLGEVSYEGKRVVLVKDMNYDDVIVYDDSVDIYWPIDAEYSAENGGVWKAEFPFDMAREELRICLKQGDKLTYYKGGKVERISIHTVFDYYPEQESYWLDGGFRTNSTGEYNAEGKLENYGYKKQENGYFWFMRYNMRNELLSMAYDLPDGDHWYYTQEDGWENWAYGDDQYRRKTPPESVVAAVLPPIKKQTYQVPAVTNAAEMKGTDVPFVLADAQTMKIIEQEGLELGVTAYPPQEQQIRYDLSWVNAAGKPVSGINGVDVVLAWPYGLDTNWAKNYAFVVEHTTASGAVEVFSTLDGTAECTDAGLKIHVSSFSPFVLNWGSEQEMQGLVNRQAAQASSLPQTGDSSSLLLWMGMLMLSLCAFAAGRKARA